MGIQTIRSCLLIVFTTLIILTGCGVTVEQQNSPFPKEKNDLIFQVEIEASDTIKIIEDRYKGTMIAWIPEDGVAILTGNASKQLAQQNVLTESNIDAVSVPDSDEVAGSSNFGSGNFGSGNFGSGNFGSGNFGSGNFGSGVNVGYLTHNETAWDQVELFDAHKISKNLGQGIKVAVLDTGVDTNHNLLTTNFSSANEWRDYVDSDFNPADELGGRLSGHGTAVTGIVLQVAPKSTVLPIRVLDIDGTGDMDALVSGIMHSVSAGADVINLSLGSFTSSSVLNTAIQYAKKQGVYVIAAAGNQGANKSNFPARMSNWKDYKSHLIGVGSVDGRYNRSKFSNYGGFLHSAPGEGVQTTYPGDRFVNATGTSFSTPIVAGGIALLLSENSSAVIRTEIDDSLRFPSTHVQGTVSVKLLLDTVLTIVNPDTAVGSPTEPIFTP